MGRKYGAYFKWAVVFISILLSVAVGILIYNNLNLKGQISSLMQESNALENNYNALKKSHEQLIAETETLRETNLQLEKLNSQLSKSNMELKDKSASLAASMKGVESEVQKTIDKLNDFDITVTNSIRWFQANNNIMNLSEFSGVRSDVNMCAKFGKACEIDLKCIYNVNRENGIRYKYDEDTVGKPDFLKDLKLIYKQRGGDCEDFALLYMAEYNYLVDGCLKNY